MKAKKKKKNEGKLKINELNVQLKKAEKRKTK